MMDKLKAISDRLEAIVTQMEDPATYGDPDLLRRLTREQKEIEPGHYVVCHLYDDK